MKNEQGFAQIFLITLLPIIIGMFIVFYSLTGLIQLNTIASSECRRQQISVQVEVRKLMFKLFSKNPQAISLRTRLYQARIQLAAAIASSNAPLIQVLHTRIQHLNLQRQILDNHQKELISQANLLATKASIHIYLQSKKNMEALQNLSPLLQISTHSSPPIVPKLAVVPDISDVAPAYRPASDFSKLQALVQKWHYRIRVNSWLQNFVKVDAGFDKLCSTTIETEEGQWIITTKEDKS